VPGGRGTGSPPTRRISSRRRSLSPLGSPQTHPRLEEGRGVGMEQREAVQHAVRQGEQERVLPAPKRQGASCLNETGAGTLMFAWETTREPTVDNTKE
jgi:hypothetical protein